MNKDLIISSSRHETKVAILEDEQLVEVYFQRANEYSLVGSIHKGRVTRVLPGMQSAFVNIGLERDAFLYVSDFFEESEEFEPIRDNGKPARRGRPLKTSAPEEAPAPKEDNDARERRGRRSRRRRGRGRDFPDSKYAGSDTNQAKGEEPSRREEPPTTEAPASPPEPETEPESDIVLLPGESLAKYGRAPSFEAASGAETASAEAAPLPDEPADADAEAESVEAVPATDEPAGADVEAESAEAAPPPDEPAGADARQPAPDTAASGSGAEQSEDSPKPQADSGDGEEDDEEPPSGLEVEDSDIQEMILRQIDDAVMEQIDALDRDEDEQRDAARAASAGEGTDEAASGDSASAGDPGPREAFARLKEPEPRYLHRVSRRGRRRPRNPSAETRQRGADAAADTAEEEPVEKPAGNLRKVSQDQKAPLPSITDLLKEGQEVLVQVAKEPLGQKGARITSYIALPGRYVVYMPTLDHLGVSRKIESDEERQRLRRILQDHRSGIPGGFIMRTAGAGQREEDIAADMKFLSGLWMDIRQKAEKRSAPALLHHDLGIVERVVRDQVSESFRTVWVDSEEAYEGVLRFLERFQPSLVRRVKMYTRPQPIFDAFNITSEMEKALRPKVWLKSGGYIVINHTEALVAIDINTGKFVGRSHRLEDTIVKTNIEAIQEIVRQMRLRDLGGIIVVDFIDMEERRNRQKVMQALEEAMRADRAPSKVLQFNDFGLVAITRKRVRQSLERTLCSPCPYCEGAGYVKSVETIIGEILNEAHKLAGAVEGEDVMLRVHPDVAKQLKAAHNYLEELEEILGCSVMVTADPLLHHEKFDLA